MMKSLLFATFIILTTFCFAADDRSDYLIKEMETLRDSLSLDDPARVDLTLRLADLYFDISIMEGKKEDLGLLKAGREKALSLYRHTLNGTDGVQKAKGLNRLKVQFQMARLLSRLNEQEQAEKYYKEVYDHAKTPRKMREQSSLALAEWYEEDAKYKKSTFYYDEALKLCETKAICNYAHYRKGWLYYKDTKLDLAIREMKLSLYDRDKNLRENSLTDLMLFMSNEEGDGMSSLAFIKDIAKVYNRPELVRQLVEAYYVAGNRFAGSYLLADLNKNDPNLYYEVRLLEEFYGFRKWDDVESYLSQVEKRSVKDIPSKKLEKEEVLKIMRRFIVQVDSESQVIPELNTFLKRSIDVYLTLYSNDKLRKQMQQGWLKAESDMMTKSNRLGVWIKEDLAYKLESDHIRKLRQTRLSLAQKLKLPNVVIEESLAIAEILKGTKEADEFTYVAAREMYSEKQFDSALPLFQSLVSSALETKKFGKWSILSQNLVLDIFNKKKDFSSIVNQVQSWQTATAGIETKAIAAEKSSMDKILIEAQFEEATKLGQTNESLDRFFNFCFKGVFPKKSCPNAKILAVKLKDQSKLISLLEKEGDEKALLTEYELMGEYTKAAKLFEKFNMTNVPLKKVGYEDFLKTALLYELDQNYKNRDRILKKLVKRIRLDKSIPEKYEGVVFLTLDEAGFIGTESLTLPWSLKRKLSLSHRLQVESPSLASKKLLMGQMESQGPAWSKLVLNKIEAPYSKVSKIGFYGRRSQRKFKKRTRAIDNFVKIASPYLNGSDSLTRIYILDMLTKTYVKMDEEIRKTPIPEGLDEETLKMVATQIDQMAAPFKKVGEDYQRLLTAEVSSLEEEKKLMVNEQLSGVVENYASLITLPTIETFNVATVDYAPMNSIKATLKENPEDRKVLGELEKLYSEKSSKRLAAYYKGRLNNLMNEGSTAL